MNPKILSTISLCKKAGKLTLGYDMVKAAVQDGSAVLVVLAQDLSPKSRKEILRVTEEWETPVVTIPQTMDDIWMSVNKRAGILAINDEGFARLLRRELPQDEKEDTIL